MAKEYIEREAVKRELLSWAVSINHPEYLIKDDALHVIDSIPAADVVEQEQESKPLNGWISVQDRLPDKDGCYIVTACDEGCSCGDGIWYDTVVIEAEHYKGEWSWNENGTEYDITDLVTHWMPMPNPPKVE